jgi:hypothetical protein
MADSAFWRDLAEKFLASPDFRADGHYVIGSGEPWTWQLAGVAAEYIRAAFEALARRAASEIAVAGSPDLLTVWLEELRKGSYNFRISNQAHEVLPDGTEGPHYLMGSIHGVCQASATLCKKLENEAIQAEFEAEQHKNPRNWTPFHQQVEALNTLKEISTAPALRLSEEFVRSALGRIHNMKPEDVPAAIINFEIAGLTTFYKHVELIPSAPRREPPPTPEPSETNAVRSEPEQRPVPTPVETIAAQIQRLRVECKWTIPELAEAGGIDRRTVDRLLAGEFIPYPRTLSAYEKAFRKHLKRQVVLRKMP